MTRRPNFLMIMTDQHRADWLGCYGHPVIRTPNIDAIAAAGTRFSEFHVASPVCMPNRGSIMTGRYPSVHGLRHNGLALPASATTFADILRDGGYRTALIGKSHIQPMTSVAPNMGVPKPETNPRFPEAIKCDGARYDLEEPERYAGPDRFDFPSPYYGFDHIDMVTDHGDRCGGHYVQWLRRQTSEADRLRDRANQLPHNYTCPQAYRTRLPEELYPTAYVRDSAVEYLTSQADEAQPFFACVSFPDPHHPFTPPGRYWDLYHPDQFSVDVPYGAHRNPPPHLRALRAEFEDGSRETESQKLFMADDQELREAMALSAGMIAMIDNAIGTIMAALQGSGRYDDTVVIFNSDHGDYLGAYSLLLKGPVPHRSINRVPFIWSDPDGRKARVSDALASSVDIAPTIIARAQLAPYYGIQGSDLRPAISGETATLRSHLLIEHEDSQPKPGFAQRPNLRTLLTQDHRISIYSGKDWGEIYDRRADPDETYNLWDEPAANRLKTDLLHVMSMALIDAVDPSPWPRRRA